MKKSFFLMLGILFVIPVQTVQIPDSVIRDFKQAIKDNDGERFSELFMDFNNTSGLDQENDTKNQLLSNKEKADLFISLIQKLRDLGINEKTELNYPAIKDKINIFSYLLNWMTALNLSEAIKFLVENGADVNLINPDLYSDEFDENDPLDKMLAPFNEYMKYMPLHKAVANNNSSIVKYLLEKGAKVESSDFFNKISPLMIAANNDNLELFNLLLQYGANLKNKDKSGKTVLMYAANPEFIDRSEPNFNVLNYLLSSKANMFTSKEIKEAEAAKKNVYTQFNDDVNNFAQVIKNKDLQEFNLLSMGYEEKYTIKIIQKLIDSGVDIKSELCFSSYEYCIRAIDAWLFVAVYPQSYKLVEFLVQNGANVNAVLDDLTVLMTAVGFDHATTMVELLLKYGANINAVTVDEGFTALMIAARNDKLETVKFLLDHGADIQLKDTNGKTVLWYAANSRHQSYNVLDYLLSDKSKYFTEKEIQEALDIKEEQSISESSYSDDSDDLDD